MPQQFEVEPEQLRSHASDIEGIKGKADTALDAANQVGTQAFDMAYGVVCQSFPQAMRPVEDKATETVQDAARALRSMADSLTKSADHYQRVDGEHASALEQIGGMFVSGGLR